LGFDQRLYSAYTIVFSHSGALKGLWVGNAANDVNPGGRIRGFEPKDQITFSIKD
jgi:hypothetical protein